jgi:amino acid transporter
LSKDPASTSILGPEPEAVDQRDFGLRRHVLGSLDCIAQSVSTMAPTASAAMTVPLVFASAGRGTWVSYLLATVCILLVGLCISRFARDSASPGSLYTYATTSLPPVLRSVAAWALVIAYIASGASVVGGFVHYANVVLAEFLGLKVPATLLAAACVILPVWVAYRDVKVSARLMLSVEAVSMLMISVVFALVLWKHGLHLDTAQFKLQGVQFSGVRLGLVLAMFSFVGFESATTLGQEVKEPLRTIPRAIILSAVLSGLFFIASSYTEVLGFPASAGSLADSDSPLSVLSTSVGVRPLGPVIDVCVMVTMLACTLACITAAARVLLLMAHNGLAPKALCAVHARNQTPHGAILATGLVTALLSLPLVAFNVSGETIYDWMGSLCTYGFITVYALVALALPLYLRKRTGMTLGSIVLATLAIAAMGMVLAGTLYPVPEAPKNWLPYLFLLYLGIAATCNHCWSGRVATAVDADGAASDA